MFDGCGKTACNGGVSDVVVELYKCCLERYST